MIPVRPEPQATRATKGIPELQEQRVPLEYKVIKVIKEIQELLVLLVLTVKTE